MYYIYHIPGIKIGCTIDMKRRARQGSYTNYEILETHLDGWLAGDREIELQKQYGYQVETVHYMIRVQRFNDSRTLETYIKVSESKKGKTFTDQHKLNISAANIGNSNAKGTIRSEENKKKISDSLKGNTVNDDIRSKISNTMKGRKQPIVICPHCNKPGGKNAMKRRHFDNCKQKKSS